MKSNPEFQEVQGPREGAEGRRVGTDSRCSRRILRRCFRWGERILFSVLMLALMVFTVRMAFTNLAETAAAESVPREETSSPRAAQGGKATNQQELNESEGEREPTADENQPAGAKTEKTKERTQTRLGIFRLGGDHASDVEAVYREAAVVWGLEG